MSDMNGLYTGPPSDPIAPDSSKHTILSMTISESSLERDRLLKHAVDLLYLELSIRMREPRCAVDWSGDV